MPLPLLSQEVPVSPLLTVICLPNHCLGCRTFLATAIPLHSSATRNDNNDNSAYNPGSKTTTSSVPFGGSAWDCNGNLDSSSVSDNTRHSHDIMHDTERSANCTTEDSDHYHHTLPPSCYDRY